MAALMQGGLASVGLFLVLWMTRKWIPGMEARHEREIGRMIAQSELASAVYQATIDRIVCAYEKRTDAIVMHLEKIDDKVDSISAILVRTQGTRVGDLAPAVGGQ